MTEKELDNIIDQMTTEQLKGYAKIGFMYAFRLIKRIIENQGK